MPEINKEFSARNRKTQGILLKYLCKNWSRTSGVPADAKTKPLPMTAFKPLVRGTLTWKEKTMISTKDNMLAIKSHQVLEETNQVFVRMLNIGRVYKRSAPQFLQHQRNGASPSEES